MSLRKWLPRLDFAAAALAAAAAAGLCAVAALAGSGWLERHGTSVQPIPLLVLLAWSAGNAALLGLAGLAQRRGWALRWPAQGLALLWLAAPALLQGLGLVKWF
ncbi:MAG TPA: hypothetical protein VFA75_11745 [Nevskia sp.]|nr:hypothetical protein [Nevskia sp.]